jgi:hypothetical protein
MPKRRSPRNLAGAGGFVVVLLSFSYSTRTPAPLLESRNEEDHKE